MAVLAAQFLIGLGVLHVIIGVVQFRVPLRETIAEGFVGRFMRSDTRRLAFWFILVGPLLSLLGQVALHTARAGDTDFLRTIGCYLLGAAIVGVLAFPKSPLWLLIPPSAILIATGFGWIA